MIHPILGGAHAETAADLNPKGKEVVKEKTKQGGDDEHITTDSDPTAAIQNLQPNIPKDYELFLNLVEFSKKILLIEGTRQKDGGNQKAAVKKERPDLDMDTSAVEEEEVIRSQGGTAAGDAPSCQSAKCTVTVAHSSVEKRPRKAFFVRWVYLFGREVIARCNEYPLISGRTHLTLLPARSINCAAQGSTSS